MVAFTRPQRAYDHRLHELVYHSGLDSSHVGIAIPRSTLHTWKSRAPKPVVGLVTSDNSIETLESEVARLTLQVRKLRCLLRLVLAILKLSGFSLELTRLPEGKDKQRLLREVERVHPVSAAQSARHDSTLSESIPCLGKEIPVWIDRHAIVSKI
jgi:hypothetical protein